MCPHVSAKNSQILQAPELVPHVSGWILCIVVLSISDHSAVNNTNKTSAVEDTCSSENASLLLMLACCSPQHQGGTKVTSRWWWIPLSGLYFPQAVDCTQPAIFCSGEPQGDDF